MKKFQISDKHENRHERPQQSTERYERPQQRTERYERPQQRTERYERPQQRHDRYERPPQQRPRTEETKRFSKFDSSVNETDNFSDENGTMEHKKKSHQIEERIPRNSSQVYMKALKDLEKNKHDFNKTDEHKHLNKTNSITEQSGSKEDYEIIRKGFHPLSTEQRMLYPCSKNLNVKDEVFSLNDAKSGCLKERKDSYISEENSSRNLDVKNLQFVNENLLPFHQSNNTLPYASNLNERRERYINEESSSENHDLKNLNFGNENILPFLQRSNIPYNESNQNERVSYIGKGSSSENSSDVKNLQFDSENPLLFLQRMSASYESNQSNAYVDDISETVYAQEAKEKFQSDKNIMPNSSLRAVSPNNSSEEDMGFNMLKLTDLIHYNANLMQGQKLFEFTLVVKSKILEKIDKFEYPEKDELHFLCEISDGDQSEKNQRIITSRACRIVRNIIDKFPHLLNVLEPPLPPPQIVVYERIPSSHAITNSYCNNHESAVLDIVQNSEVMTPTANYNTMPTYNVPSTARFVVAKEILDSSDSDNSNNHINSCEAQKLSTINAKSNSPINLSLITNENKDVEEPSKCHTSPINPGGSTPMHEFSFNEKKSFFSSLRFNDLLYYNVDKMQGDMIFDYAFSMKHRIIKKINLNQFRSPYKEKLYFLCQLTDGTQQEQNQKLINKRMCDLIISDYEERLKECNKNFLDEQSENDHQRRSH